MSISTALFSSGQARVFRWVFGQPAREFYLSELRRLSGLGSATLQRELNALADAGLAADPGNKRRILTAFPEMVATYGTASRLHRNLREGVAA
jgi:hypothetical protein